ncbi:MAG TPA: flagellar biosynthesis protein FlhA [Candidatus Latescibacteria bacterium]|nr:flagellar biosynthesis protein FlhA [Candidatus Latescibacterota bacterium]
MNGLLGRISAKGDLIVAVGVVAILIVMTVPMPPFLLDLLLTLNISLALIVLLVSMYTVRPLEFSTFPSLLLVLTLSRLSLNVASTRLILGDAYAGRVIQAFGSFVVKGNYALGLVIFLILVLINFVVITRGAGRIAEVAARFTLDAMPGKQMSIDADLNAGLIDEREARRRREDVAREADFYGAMDGASKFVRGDAIAGLIITAIDIVGGFFVGVAQKGMGLSQAIHTYTVLTVGDGLVSQIPALMISTSAGILVSRAAAEANLGRDVTFQILSHPKATLVASGVLVVLGIMPGMPTVPFLTLAAVVGAVGYTARRTEAPPEEEAPAQEVPKEDMVDYLRVDPVEVEIGYGLIPIVDVEQGGDLLDRVVHIRKELALELGVLVPPIRIRDNIQLKPDNYVILIWGEEVARGELTVGQYLALNPGTATEEIPGRRVREPAFGLEAVWISEGDREKAEFAGYTVVEAPAVLATHLSEVLKAHAHRLLSRQDVQNLLDNVKKQYPAVVDELVPGLMNLGGVQKVLQNLLKEKVPIRDMVTILETLADHASAVQDPDMLTEYVRQALGRTICSAYVGEDKTLVGITLDPNLEQALSQHSELIAQGRASVLPPEQLQKLYGRLGELAEDMADEGFQPLVLCAPKVRLYFRRLVEPKFPDIPVISYAEVPVDVSVRSFRMLSLS